MTNHRPQEKKRKRIKGTSYTPDVISKNPSKNSASQARTLQTTKLKSISGGFRVASSRGISGVSVPNVDINDPRSTEDIIDSWFETPEEYGWDEAYVNGFVEKETVPPSQDPETAAQPTKSTGKGVRIPTFRHPQTVVTVC